MHVLDMVPRKMFGILFIKQIFMSLQRLVPGNITKTSVYRIEIGVLILNVVLSSFVVNNANESTVLVEGYLCVRCPPPRRT